LGSYWIKKRRTEIHLTYYYIYIYTVNTFFWVISIVGVQGGNETRKGTRLEYRKSWAGRLSTSIFRWQKREKKWKFFLPFKNLLIFCTFKTFFTSSTPVHTLVFPKTILQFILVLLINNIFVGSFFHNVKFILGRESLNANTFCDLLIFHYEHFITILVIVF
jgi:hypothetical protein